jgi:diguanylate cyclase (GGDEF)-like protein
VFQGSIFSLVAGWFERRLPGMRSYRGRYAYFALLTSVTLIAIAYMGWDYVNRTGHQQIALIESRNIAAAVLSDALDSLNLIENNLQRILLEPSAEELDKVDMGLKHLGFNLDKLAQVYTAEMDANLEVSRELQKDAGRLQVSAKELIAIRSDVERWFPALRLMREEMLPHSQQLLSLLSLLQFETDDDLRPGQRLRFFQTVSDLRWDWLNMTSEFRLFVANRFGIFASEFRSGMESRLINVRYFAEEIPLHLAVLKRMAAAGDLGFNVTTSLEQIEQHYAAWIKAFDRMSTNLENPGWREDLMFMAQTVKPILERMRQRLSYLNLDLDTQSARNITQLTEIARQLSKFILAISMVGIFLIMAAYLFLHRYLLKPIAETALALKQEAQGLVDIEPPPARLQETRDLVDAFTEMRRQVHTRQRSLDHMVHHDALTQLPNRVLFHDRLKHALEIASREEQLVGLMFLDLDRFKQVNDSMGHLVGDELLKIVAGRLRSLVRASDTVARLGGDEFAILVEGLEDRDVILTLADKALRELKKPIHLGDQIFIISASIGIALAPFDDVIAEHLISDADTAMYEAKRQGRAMYCLFNGEMVHRVTQYLSLEHEIRQGIELKHFVYHYQAVVAVDDDRLIGCEALLRWRHPEKGLLAPEVFLDTLDTSGLISQVIDELLDQAIAHQAEFHRRTGRSISVAINLSVRLLNDPSFCRRLLKRLLDGQFADGGLVLEITEDILSQELAEAEVFLQQVKTLGGRIALDDFGTGQASLSHLRMFPFDLLKIDRGFIHSADADPNYASLIEAIVNLSHAFSMPVVAEGVETPEQQRFVRRLGCDYVQGHLQGKPMESSTFIETILAHPHLN